MIDAKNIFLEGVQMSNVSGTKVKCIKKKNSVIASIKFYYDAQNEELKDLLLSFRFCVNP